MRLTRLAAALVTLCAGTPLAHADGVAVGPQYDTTHVYIAPSDADRFAQSFVATFGGKSTPQGIATVTPTPSSTSTQLLITPAGLVSLFGFRTPVPYPFGSERTGYLVRNLDDAVAAARAAGAAVIVSPFPDPIGRDAVIQWPGGIAMQLYWHTKPSSFPPLASVPDNRIYLSADSVDAFVKDWQAFAGATVVSDEAAAPGAAIGRPGTTFRRIRLASGFGDLLLLVTDGHLPYPYGRETTGYGVTDLSATLARAKAAGVRLLVTPQSDGHRLSAMVGFPGGYVAEIHSMK